MKNYTCMDLCPFWGLKALRLEYTKYFCHVCQDLSQQPLVLVNHRWQISQKIAVHNVHRLWFLFLVADNDSFQSVDFKHILSRYFRKNIATSTQIHVSARACFFKRRKIPLMCDPQMVSAWCPNFPYNHFQVYDLECFKICSHFSFVVNSSI